MIKDQIEKLRGGLVVSCQAPKGSPLDDPRIIAALALTAEQNGAVGVRINTPEHIAATKLRVGVPIIGIEKVVTPGSDVYITPTYEVAERVAASGAEIIAIDATVRRRPNGERLGHLIRRVRQELGKPVVADVATLEEGLSAAELGVEAVATTLCGYTAETKGADLPAFGLLENLAGRLNIPVVCEGHISSPEQVRRAFDCGAFAVVVGTAITGIGSLVQRYAACGRRQGHSPHL